MEGTPQPRRALGPLPGDPDSPAEAVSPASPDPRTDDSAVTDTARMRRLAFALDDEAPTAPRITPATSVPPPRPVLPVWEPLPASAGRRFSADDAPYESDWAAPRRSAASVSSPMSDYEPLLPPVNRPSAPPPVTVPYQPVGRAAKPAPSAPLPVPSMAMPAGTEGAAASAGQTGPGVSRAKGRTDSGRHAAEAEPRKRSRLVAIIVAAVLALALIGGAIVWATVLRPSSGVTNPATQAVDPLLAPTEAAALGAGSWQEAGVTKTPLCVGQDTEPAAQRTASRMLTSSSGSVLQLVHTFADDQAATTAYAAQLTQAGGCAGDNALVVGASTVKGLADSADAVRLTIQGATDEHHVLLLTRSGRTLNTFDVTGAADLPVATVADVARTALSRQCSAGGTCPTTVTVADSLPAAGDPAGWLVAADLPQITPGSGKWTALPTQAIELQGSQCEDTDLTRVTGTTDSAERIFVLTGDSKAPARFGINHAVWTFGTTKSASALADKLSTNISGCTKNTPTATVKAGASVKGVGNGVQVTGKSWEITHKLSTGNIMFRVAVITSGTRVSYLLANPSADFDFTDAEWTAIALRAGQRASQAG